jgi:hypothetical protein
MMLIGFAGLGLTTYRRQRRRSDTLARANPGSRPVQLNALPYGLGDVRPIT